MVQVAVQIVPNLFESKEKVRTTPWMGEIERRRMPKPSLHLANIDDWVMFVDLDNGNAFEKRSLDRLHLLNISRNSQGGA